MANAKKCDRCGSVYDLMPEREWHSLVMYRIANFDGISFPGDTIDLCPECRAKFFEFMGVDWEMAHVERSLRK